MSLKTPPEDPNAIYDRVIVLYLKESPPCTHLPMDWRAPDGRALQEILTFDPTKEMTNAQQLRTFKYLEKKNEYREFSVFAGIEKGVTLNRIQEQCDKVNQAFAGLHQVGKRLALKTRMIPRYGEKMMKDFTYEECLPNGKFIFHPWKKTATRSQAVANLPRTGDEAHKENESDDDFDFRQSKDSSKKRRSASKEDEPSQKIAKSASKSPINPFYKELEKKGRRGAGGVRKSAAVAMEEMKKTLSQSPSAKTIDKGTNKPEASPQQKRSPKDTKTLPKKSPKKPTTVVEEEKKQQDDVIELSSSPDDLRAAAYEELLKAEKAVQEDTEQQAEASQHSSVGGSQKLTLDIPLAQGYAESEMGTEAKFFINMPDEEKERLFTSIQARIQQIELQKAMKNAMIEVYEQVLAPRLDSLFRQIQDVNSTLDNHIAQYKKDIGELKAKPAMHERTLKVCNEIKEMVAKFATDTVAVKMTLHKAATDDADVLSQAIGIICRQLPFDEMGPGMDAFFANHLIQDLLAHYIVPYCGVNNIDIDYTIAKAVMDKFFTPCALAHLVHKLGNYKTAPFFKRPLPPAIMLLIENRLIVRLKKALAISEKDKFADMRNIKDQMSQKMTNARTTFIRTAMRKAPNPEFAVNAMYEVDLDFYSLNSHAMDKRIQPWEMDAYLEDLSGCAEYRDAIKLHDSLKDEAKKEANDAAKQITVQDIFKKLRRTPGTKLLSVYKIVKMIVGIGYLLNKDLDSMQYDDCPEVPELLATHRQIVDEYKGRYEVLIQEFIGMAPNTSRMTVDYSQPKVPPLNAGIEPTPRKYVKSPRKLPGEYVADIRARENLTAAKEIDFSDEGSEQGKSCDDLNKAGPDIVIFSSDESSKSSVSPDPSSAPPAFSTVEQAMMAAAGPSSGPLADAMDDPEAVQAQLDYERRTQETLARAAEESRMLKEYDAKKKAMEKLLKEIEDMKAKISPN